MSPIQKEPRPGNHFRLKLGGRQTAGLFREVSGLSSELQVVETQVGDNNGLNRIVKIPGAQKTANITLKRGADANKILWEWFKNVRANGPEGQRVDITIEMCNYDGRAIHTYTAKQAFPIKYDGATLNTQGNEVAIETLTLAHEGIDLV